MPKSVRSFEVSSGGFSAAAVGLTEEVSEVEDGAVEAGESSKEPDDVEAMARSARTK